MQIEEGILNIGKTKAYYEIINVDGDNLQLKIIVENENGLESIEYPDTPGDKIIFSDKRTINTKDIVLKEAEEYEVKIKAEGRDEEIHGRYTMEKCSYLKQLIVLWQKAV